MNIYNYSHTENHMDSASYGLEIPNNHKGEKVRVFCMRCLEMTGSTHYIPDHLVCKVSIEFLDCQMPKKLQDIKIKFTHNGEELEFVARNQYTVYNTYHRKKMVEKGKRIDFVDEKNRGYRTDGVLKTDDGHRFLLSSNFISEKKENTSKNDHRFDEYYAKLFC